MGLHETEVLLSEEYQGQLAEAYGPDITRVIANDWQHADLSPYTPEGKILYVRIGQETATEPSPVLYIPGFTEGIVAKAPFAADMASRGFDITLPGQYRKGILRDALDKKNATYSQAVNYLAVAESSGLTESEAPVHVVTHSYGILIFQAMQRIAHERGLDLFKDSKVAALAPAASNANENPLTLGGRFGQHMWSENFTDKDFHDPGDMLKAGAKNLLANLPRSAREVGHMARQRVDYEELAVSGIAEAIVFGYAEDRLFPHRVLESTMAKAMEAGIAYAVPISLEERDGQIRGGKDASHNDEQFNPSRVAGAVAQFLQAT